MIGHSFFASQKDRGGGPRKGSGRVVTDLKLALSTVGLNISPVDQPAYINFVKTRQRQIKKNWGDNRYLGSESTNTWLTGATKYGKRTTQQSREKQQTKKRNVKKRVAPHP